MKANVFVREHGWYAASNIVDGWIYRDFNDSYHIADGIYCNLPFETTDDCGTLSLYDLKRLVKSYELVQVEMPELKKSMFSNSKDLEYVKNWLLAVSDKLLTEKGIKLKQAISDVESCL